IAGDDRVGFGGNPYGSRIGVGACAGDLAHDIVGAHRKPAAFIEIGDRDAHRGIFDDIAGDDGTFKGEFDENGHFAEPRAGIVDDLAVVPGIIADRAKGTVTDAVLGDQHIAGAKYVDAVAVLAAAAVLRRDLLDAVAGDDRAVFALIARPHLNAVIADLAEMISGDFEALRIEAEES